MEKKSERAKDIAGILGIGMMFATALMTIITWLTAWWNGVTTGSYTVLVNINAAGEMVAEFWLVWIVLGFSLWGICWYIHEAMLEKEELGRNRSDALGLHHDDSSVLGENPPQCVPVPEFQVLEDG